MRTSSWLRLLASGLPVLATEDATVVQYRSCSLVEATGTVRYNGRLLVSRRDGSTVGSILYVSYSVCIPIAELLLEKDKQEHNIK